MNLQNRSFPRLMSTSQVALGSEMFTNVPRVSV